MKTTQSVLPAATLKKCRTEKEIGAQIKANLTRMFKNGFWYCCDCETRCEMVEGEHGQPNHCDRCGSHKITWEAPAWSESIPVQDTQLIHPREL
jgi:uncharacterized paraquat-inducible protein A